MRILKSHLLTDGKLFNDGRPVDLIHIEEPADYDTLLDNILSSGYYDHAYFDSHIDYREGEVKFDAFFLASILKFLKPGALLELGCGRGDVLFLLGLDGSIEVRGIEFSRDILQKAWPALNHKIDFGDVLEVSRSHGASGITFDTFCAFDIWEHLHPQRLHEYIDAIVSLARKEALFFFNIPAVGEDRVWGEVFPLELEENRGNFNRRLPFDYLNAEILEPPIPANGHLIWAHTEWWQKQFEAHGLIRAEALEKNIHTYFDEHLFYARKSFFIFHLDSREARHRVRQLSQKGLTLYQKWKLWVDLQAQLGQQITDRQKAVIDLQELRSTLNHAEFYMLQDLKKKLKGCPEQSPQSGSFLFRRKPFRSLSEKMIDKGLDTWIKFIRKHRYFL
jgi:SAM-dependent methyltransferase